MNKIFEVDAWDMLTITLVKALAGNTTPNFWQVMLDSINGKWILRFALFFESDEDRDLVADISTEFYSYSEEVGVLSRLDDLLGDEIVVGNRPSSGYSLRAVTVFSISK